VQADARHPPDPLVSFGHIGHQNIAFTQSALYMFLAVGLIALLTIVPPRCQSVQADARHPPDDQDPGGPFFVSATGKNPDPIHQFELKPLVSFGHIGHQNIAFTQSALYMFLAVGSTNMNREKTSGTKRSLPWPADWCTVWPMNS
jgi:hypothetical protein